MLEAIREAIEWFASDSASLAGLFPYAVLGIMFLYLAWLLVGYLRVSQVGLGGGHESEAPIPVAQLPDSAATEPPRGIPYCPVDGLRYPADALYCARDETDLLVSCANCGTTVRAADDTCYHCGTHHTTADVSGH